MKRRESLLAELSQEAAATRTMLALVPFEKGNFKPHEKSMSLLQLATHVTEIIGWWKECLIQDELDFAKGDFTPKKVQDTAELVAYFDTLLASSQKILSEVTDEEFEKSWTMRQGETIYFTLPKKEVVRTWCLNHLYHHRGQLSVYLRLLDIALPPVYGPTADMM